MQLLPHFVALLSLPFFAQVSGSPIAQRDPPTDVDQDPIAAAATRVYTEVIGARTAESVVATATATVLEVESEVTIRRTTVVPAEAAPTYAGISGVAIPRKKGAIVPAVPLNRIQVASAGAQPIAAENIRPGRVAQLTTIHSTRHIAETSLPTPARTRATDDELREIIIEEEVQDIQRYSTTIAERATPRPTRAAAESTDDFEDVNDIVEVLGGVPVNEAAKKIQASVDQAQAEREEAAAEAGAELIAEPTAQDTIEQDTIEPILGAISTGAVDPTTGWRVMRAPMVVVEPGVQVVRAPANAAAAQAGTLNPTNPVSVLTTDGSSSPQVVQAPRVPIPANAVNTQGKQVPDDLSAVNELSSRPAYVAAAPRRLVIPQEAVPPQGATEVTVIPPVQNIVREVPVAQKVQVGQAPVVAEPANVVMGKVQRENETVVVEEQRKVAEKPVVVEKKPVVAENIVEKNIREKLVEPIEKVIAEIEAQEAKYAPKKVENKTIEAVEDSEEEEAGTSVLDSAVDFASNVVSKVAAVPSKIAQTVAGLAGSVAGSNSDQVKEEEEEEEDETREVEVKKPVARVENPIVEQTKLVRVQKPVVETPKKVVKVEKPVEKVVEETIEIDEIDKIEVLEVSATPTPTPSPAAVTPTPHVISPIRPAILDRTPLATRTPVVVVEKTLPIVQVVQQKVPVPVTIPVVVNRPVPVPVVVEKTSPIDRIVEKTTPTIPAAVAQAPPLSRTVTQTTLSATVIPVATVPVVIAHSSSIPVTISRTVPIIAPLVAAPIAAPAFTSLTTLTTKKPKTPTTVTQSLVPLALATAPAVTNPKPTTIEQQVLPASDSTEQVPLVESCPAPFIRKCCQALIPALDITSKLFDGVQCVEVAKGEKCMDYYREACCSGEVAGEGRWKWDLGCAGINVKV